MSPEQVDEVWARAISAEPRDDASLHLLLLTPLLRDALGDVLSALDCLERTPASESTWRLRAALDDAQLFVTLANRELGRVLVTPADNMQ